MDSAIQNRRRFIVHDKNKVQRPSRLQVAERGVLQYIVLGFIVNSAYTETEESPAIQYMRSLEDNFVAD